MADHGQWGMVKGQRLLRATKDRKLWKEADMYDVEWCLTCPTF